MSEQHGHEEGRRCALKTDFSCPFIQYMSKQVLLNNAHASGRVSSTVWSRNFSNNETEGHEAKVETEKTAAKGGGRS